MRKLFLCAVLLCSFSAWGQLPDCSKGFCAGIGSPMSPHISCKAGYKYTQLDAPGTGWSCTGVPPDWVQDAGGGGGSLQPGQLALVKAEDFGAVGDWNGTTGTDNTTALQNAINSIQSSGVCGQVLLQAKLYKISGTLNITSSCVGIRGTAQGGALSLVNPSGIVMTSASADIIDVAGANSSSLLEYNTFSDFALERTVAPTGTAAGLSLSYVAGADITHVQVMDSARGFYFHMAPSRSVSKIEDSLATFGFGSVTGYTGGTYSGFYLDSADGNPQFSFRGRHLGTSSNLIGTANVRGFDVEGTAIQDVMVNGFESAGGKYGIYINHTGSTANSALDLHFWNSILDGFSTTAIYVNGATAASGGRIEFNGGYALSLGSTADGIDIEGSSGVNVANMMLGPFGAGISDYVLINGGSGNSITNNSILSPTVNGITLNSTLANAITGNTISGNSATGGLINLVSGTYNAITGNVLAGSAAAGVQGDSGSTNNTGLDTNMYANGLTAANTMLGLNPLILNNSSAAPGMYITNNVANGYSQIAYGGTTSATKWQTGTGNPSESGLGVANKYYVYNAQGPGMAFAVDSSNNFGIGRTTPFPATFPALLSVGTSSQFQVATTGAVTEPSATIGTGGTALSRYARYAVTLSPAAVAANTCASQSFTVTGVVAGDFLIGAQKPTEQAGLSVHNGHVSGSNTATLNFCNNTGSSITPTASETYQFVVVQ